MNFRALTSLLVGSIAALTASAYNFSISQLQGISPSSLTSLQFGPDHRLYVTQVNGQILALTVQRTAANDYDVIDTEIINLVRDIPNYNDDGTRNTALTTRQATGLLVVGTASNPILYVASSDPRIGGGSGGENDLNLDTNSGIISRLTRSGSTWTKIDIVRGLPRSEENHATNGMQYDPVANWLYVAQGGNTNAGGPSVGFAFLCETALSAAILSVDLSVIDAMPVLTDAYGQKYLYDLPTLNDPNPARAHNPNGADVNDPFGGNDGLNQARLVPGGPVQIYASGFRNSYDVVRTRTPGREGRLYTFDNGPNQGWGGYPKNEGATGAVTNEYVDGEPGTVNNKDNLHFITGPGFYGGHPNPIRANPAGAGWFHFDNSQPAGSEKTFSPQPTSDWPPVAVAMANPVEGDYRQPGVSDGALLTYTASTNGLTEYVANNFSGEMTGNLIAATYDGKLLRIVLNQAGTAVTNGVELLAGGFGNLPLDVTAPDPAHGAPFVGTLWVAHYTPAKISVLEPEDFDSPGGPSCTGVNSFNVDEDFDGYSNADEIASNSDPCSAAIRPPDADEDFISDLTDTDDDNDGIADLQDPFPLDPSNGQSVPLPVHYELFNETGIGFFGVGFTGVMMNPGQDYLQRIGADNVIAGGTAGLFTLAEVGSGTARGGSNNQNDAYQFALNSDEFTTPYIISSRLAGPFFAGNPTADQTQGIYLGTGDQNNYLSVAIHANGGGGGIEVVQEQGDSVVAQAMYPLSNLSTLNTVDLYLTVDPQAATVQPGFAAAGESAITPLGSPLTVGGEVLAAIMGSRPLAIGEFANTGGGGAPTFAATWDYFSVQPMLSTAFARLAIDPTVNNMATASTYTTGGFQLTNFSSGGQHIETVSIDISTAIFPDMVFDTTGTAGDPDFKAFDPDSATSGVSLIAGTASQPHNGTNSQDGYDALDITFNSFPPAGTFTFSIDVDPTSVKGVAAPGQNHSASVSGLELIGSTVSIFFSDGAVHRTRLGRVENSVDGSYGWLRSDKPPQPGIAVVGKSTPLTTGQPENVRVTGPAGFTASLVTVEGALYVGGVPGGGYDLDPYEANTAIKVTEATALIPASGYVDFAVTPTKSDPDGGYNYLTAVLSNDAGIKGPASNSLTIIFDPGMSGGDTQPPSTPGNLASSGITGTSITLDWTASTDNVGVTGYDVLRNGTVVTTTTGVTYTDFGLDPNTNYSYGVRARDSAANLSTAATLGATTAAGGTVVLRVNAGGPSYVDSNGKTWAADTGFNTGSTASTTLPIDRTIDDTLYKTERYDLSTAPPLTYSFPLTNGQYEVQLFFTEVHTASSGPGLRVFDVSIEGSLAFDDLDIFAQAGGPATALVASANTTLTDGQLNITFIHNVQNPKVCAIKVIRLPAGETTPPTTPGNLTATNVTENGATLQWTASTDNVGVTGYVISRNSTAIQTVTALSFSDTGLLPSTTYQYEVRATDAAGNLSSPASLNVTTLASSDTVNPTPPGNLTFTSVTSTSVTVNWTAATDNVGVTGYRVSRDGVVQTTVTGLSFNNTGLSANTSYVYSVVALDAVGNASTAVSGTITTGATSPAGTLRINAGGPAYVDVSGNTWAADAGFNTGKIYTNTENIAGTEDDTLFRTERWDEPTGSELTYTLDVPNGNYLVRLHFAETYNSTKGVGLRVFDIDIQAQRAFEDVDIFALAGGGNQALALQAPATTTNGKIVIKFIHQTQNPKVNTIEIIPATGPTDTQAPSAPASLTSSAITSTGATLQWNASTDNVGVTGYVISRNGTTIQTVTALSFSDTGLSPATTYSYEVRAKDAAGNLSAPASISVTTLAGTDTQNPTPPGNLTFTNVTSSTVTVNWTAATDNVAVTGYRVSRDGSVQSTVTGLSFSDSGLTASTSYNYSVVALDAASNASTPASASITTGTSTPPAAIRINAGGAAYVDTAGNSWSADTGFNTGNVYTHNETVSGTSDVTLFRSERYDPDTGSELVYTINVPNGNYLVRLHFAETYTSTKGVGLRVFDVDIQGDRTFEDVDIFALAGGGNQALTLQAPVTVTTNNIVIGFVHQTQNPKINAIEILPVSGPTDTQPPTTPGNLATTSVTDTDVALTWTASTDNTGVTGYRVSRSGVLLGAVTATSFNDDAVEPATAYTYTVVAIDAAGNASTAASLDVTTPSAADTQPPTAPTNLAATTLTSSSITLEWTAATDNTAVTGYRISRDGDLRTTVTTTSFTEAVDASMSYVYEVVAIDAANNASTAASLNVTTPSQADTQPPTAPTNLAATTLTSSSITLEWTAATDNTAVTGYRVSRDGDLRTTVTTTSFTEAVDASTSYVYEVVAIDAASNASPPATLNVTTPGGGDNQAPTAPADLAATAVTTTSVNLSWTAASDNIGVAGYEVYRGSTLVGTVSATGFSDSGLTANTSYTYTVVAFDAAENSTGSAPLTVLTESSYMLRVNAGGSSYTDTMGHVWLSDRGYNTGKIATNTSTVSGTTDPALFRNERYDEPTGNELSYNFPVANGSYLVRLFFAETYSATQGAGLRVFDIDLQSVRTFEDVDIFTQAGGGNQALVLSAPVTITTGTINIRFLHQVQNPKVNAIEIRRAASN